MNPATEAYSGTFSIIDGVVLACLLFAAVCLRAIVLDWGLPPPSPHVVASDIRSSYALDEDDILTAASFTRPAELNFDVRMYHWGTLHIFLTVFTLDTTEQFGFFRQPWRSSYYNMVPGEFQRVYRLARWLSVVLSLVSIAGVYWLAFALAGRGAAFWAAAIITVSPVHFLTSTQIRADATAAALTVMAAVLGLQVIKTGGRRALIALGFVSGLATTAKYSSIFVIAAICIVVIYYSAGRRTAVVAVLAGFAAGIFVGQPYWIARWSEIFQQLSAHAGIGRPAPPGFALSLPMLIWNHAENIFRFGLGPVAAAFSAAGILTLARRRSATAILILAGLAGSLLVLVPLKWPLLRYELTVLPWLAIAAGVALSRLARQWQWPAGIAALAFPLAGTIVQANYMRSPHPANTMLDTILRSVPPGEPIARLIAELPPLDRKTYPMGPNPLLDDLTRGRTPWVLTTDLPDIAYPAGNVRLLATEYDEVAVFRLRRIMEWATLGESGAPHDWKYTHPQMSLYRRRAQ